MTQWSKTWVPTQKSIPTVNFIRIQLPDVGVALEPLLGDRKAFRMIWVVWTGNVIGHDPAIALLGRTKLAWKKSARFSYSTKKKVKNNVTKLGTAELQLFWSIVTDFMTRLIAVRWHGIDIILPSSNLRLFSSYPLYQYIKMAFILVYGNSKSGHRPSYF